MVHCQKSYDIQFDVIELLRFVNYLHFTN
jgi:hypothetical protein